MTEVFLDIKKDSCGGIILQKSCLIVLNSLSRFSFVTLLFSEAILFVSSFCCWILSSCSAFLLRPFPKIYRGRTYSFLLNFFLPVLYSVITFAIFQVDAQVKKTRRNLVRSCVTRLISSLLIWSIRGAFLISKLLMILSVSLIFSGE